MLEQVSVLIFILFLTTAQFGYSFGRYRFPPAEYFGAIGISPKPNKLDTRKGVGEVAYTSSYRFVQIRTSVVQILGFFGLFADFSKPPQSIDKTKNLPAEGLTADP